MVMPNETYARAWTTLNNAIKYLWEREYPGAPLEAIRLLGHKRLEVFFAMLDGEPQYVQTAN